MTYRFCSPADLPDGARVEVCIAQVNREALWIECEVEKDGDRTRLRRVMGGPAPAVWPRFVRVTMP